MINKNENFSIIFSWKEKELINTTRVGAMYCFKYCTVNTFNS